jgi:hypothetical protein
VVVAALAADHIGIRTTYVAAGLAAAVCSVGGLLLLLHSGEPSGEAPVAADAVELLVAP